MGKLNTLFTQKMLKRSYLSWNQFKPSFAHTSEIVQEYLKNMKEVIDELSLIKDNKEETLKQLVSHLARRGFYRLTS